MSQVPSEFARLLLRTRANYDQRARSANIEPNDDGFNAWITPITKLSPVVWKAVCEGLCPVKPEVIDRIKAISSHDYPFKSNNRSGRPSEQRVRLVVTVLPETLKDIKASQRNIATYRKGHVSLGDTLDEWASDRRVNDILNTLNPPSP